MKIHGTAKGGAISKKDFGVAFGGGGGGAGTVPNTVDDLYAWWDFSGEYSTITKSGTRITKITNGQGATNLDMLQGTAEYQPLWVPDDLNDKDVADFAQIASTVGGAVLQTDDSKNNVPSVSQPVTYFFVTDVPAATGETWIFDRGSGWGLDYDESRQNMGKPDNTKWFSAGAQWTLTDTGQWSYITAGFNGSSGLLRENGVENSAGAGDTGTRKISAGTIGNASEYAGFGGAWKEKIAEIIMYDRALSTSEIEGIEEYLADKWGLD